MNKILIIFFFIILTSCRQKENKGTSNDSSDFGVQAESFDMKESIEISTDIVTYFNDFNGNFVKIEVENYTQEKSFQPSDCLPLSFLQVLDNNIPQTQSESTGAKPVGKFKINDNNYFLVVVQQDDYGPIYYGLIYSAEENKIKKSEKIAEIWGDAGDSQVTYSEVSLMNEIIKIEKYIKTCHADIEVQGDEMVAKDVECSDSTATIEMKI